ncbi:MAG TPA: PilZ domain-containing protein [Terriglobia bacterium]|nr:PilZ domain-containing protein [Terriglobia bacterium]
MTRKEHRKYPRVPVRFPVECRVGDKTLRARAAILGGGGLLLEITGPPPPGTVITLRFRPAKHLPYINVQATILYHLPGQGVALEFTDLPSEDRDLILRLVEHKKGDRRKFPRVRLATQVETVANVMLTYSRDVSLGGMFVESKAPLPTGSILTLRFNLDSETSVEAKAVVTYQVKKFGMGVQFLDLAPEHRKSIEDYVAKSTVLPENP